MECRGEEQGAVQGGRGGARGSTGRRGGARCSERSRGGEKGVRHSGDIIRWGTRLNNNIEWYSKEWETEEMKI